MLRTKLVLTDSHLVSCQPLQLQTSHLHVASFVEFLNNIGCVLIHAKKRAHNTNIPVPESSLYSNTPVDTTVF